jgi:hypothetical protein
MRKSVMWYGRLADELRGNKINSKLEEYVIAIKESNANSSYKMTDWVLRRSKVLWGILVRIPALCNVRLVTVGAVGRIQ